MSTPTRSTGRPRCRQPDGRVEGGAQEELELLVLNRVVSLGSPYVEDRPRPFIDTPACRPDQSFSPGGGGSRKTLIRDRKSTRLNSSHLVISYAVFCLKKKKIT